MDITVITQLEMGTRIHTGAAVESRMYASCARATLFLSVIGRITVPTARLLK
jgi:hypothetical protein